jgi:hypothetical protein
MIHAQPILMALLAAVVALYIARLRTRLWVDFVVILCFGITAVLVVRPAIATRLAHMVGIERGVDLTFCLAILGLALLFLLLLAQTYRLNLKLTVVVREIALSNSHDNSGTDRSK